MKSIPAQLLLKMAEYKKILSMCADTAVVVGGVTMPLKAQLISLLARGSALVVTGDEAAAVRLTEELCSVMDEGTVMHYPEKELTLRPVETRSHEYELMRLSVLAALAKGEKIVVVCSVSAVLQLTAPSRVLLDNIFTLRAGDEISLRELTERLLKAGYTRAVQVEGAGQFSTRGGIVDFFPPYYTSPIRLELWGDTIDSISHFSVEQQRRTEPMDFAEVLPARELIYNPNELLETLSGCYNALSDAQRSLGGAVLAEDIERLKNGKTLTVADKYVLNIYGKKFTILDYIKDGQIFVSELSHIEQACEMELLHYTTSLEAMLSEGLITTGTGETMENPKELLARLKTKGVVAMDTQVRGYAAPFEVLALPIIPKQPWHSELSALAELLGEYVAKGYVCIIPAGTARGAAAVAEDLSHYGVEAKTIYNISDISTNSGVFVCEGVMSAGYEHTAQRILVLPYGRSATSYTSTRPKRQRKHGQGKAISSLSDVSAGDYVVHPSYGIGQFCGIVSRQFDGIVKDYIQLQYAGTDTLYVPVTQLDMVMRYVGSGEGVKLSKLNSAEWKNAKIKARASVEEIAKELIALYAARKNVKGYAFPEDTQWQKDFEHKFEYEETADQLRCIAEINADMQRSVPMDRLLCGDVGFGKTEVALRAAFKCVSAGKQCAVLVPTTILAWQHFQTFTRRMEGFPISVELLSRFKTPKQQKDIAERLKSGRVDIIIGTHRIIQKDIEFKELGLCIIDEEQRFGVAHKEKFKKLRTNIDVLTLSATPIPRTLSMAMNGIRDISLITEAPQDRQPVQTYVIEYSDGLIAEAIRRELSRGGQVFYLHNRVQDIFEVAAHISRLAPDGARIATAHGKMTEVELSEVWQQLVGQEIDILVCTTIIETGVDVPSCNTLIIEDADRMGLSQLYQLRGRVGRGARRAYAYFTFRKGRILTEIGEKRLNTIREFTSFGSGFRIAMRDLEIRGAGNILGAQQHGQIETVGYELYMRMLDEAVAELSGQPKAYTECAIDLKIPAHIPGDYIEAEELRVDMYKKIATIASMKDYMDITDELIDRFGEPPAYVMGLLDIALIRSVAAKYRISEITQRGDRLVLYMEKFDPQLAFSLVEASDGKLTIASEDRPYLFVKLLPKQDIVFVLKDVFFGVQ